MHIIDYEKNKTSITPNIHNHLACISSKRLCLTIKMYTPLMFAIGNNASHKEIFFPFEDVNQHVLQCEKHVHLLRPECIDRHVWMLPSYSLNTSILTDFLD